MLRLKNRPPSNLLSVTVRDAAKGDGDFILALNAACMPAVSQMDAAGFARVCENQIIQAARRFPFALWARQSHMGISFSSAHPGVRRNEDCGSYAIALPQGGAASLRHGGWFA